MTTSDMTPVTPDSRIDNSMDAAAAMDDLAEYGATHADVLRAIHRPVQRAQSHAISFYRAQAEMLRHQYVASILPAEDVPEPPVLPKPIPAMTKVVQAVVELELEEVAA